MTTGEATELITLPGKWEFNYTYFAGEAASRFFNELRDNRRIMGTRCPQCERVLVPARSFCDACFQRTTDWVEVGPEGTLETFTIIASAFPGLPEPPIVMAYVTLDGADTALVNLLVHADVSDIEATAQLLQTQPRVRAAWLAAQGRVTDFAFELLDF